MLCHDRSRIKVSSKTKDSYHCREPPNAHSIDDMVLWSEGISAMPPRLVSVAILVYWCIAAFCLLTWEILPELTLGYPPDLRSIAAAGDASRPVTWSIRVIDDPKAAEVQRPIGTAVTASKRLPDGWFELTSRVNFDAGNLLKGTRSRPRRAFASSLAASTA